MDLKMTVATKKYASLIVLVIQNTALVLTLRYSRRSSEGQPLYITSTAVVMTELIKFIISTCVVFYNNDYEISKVLELLQKEIFENLGDTLKLSVPAVLYTIQNNLLYVALSNLNAATFQARSYTRLSRQLLWYVKSQFSRIYDKYIVMY